ncbi:hypothetical protein EVAR_43363_1 [Eumeta japonica]|uniref:Uncharacterized protein n=1 Tax=Eumeta variegata TaxID=151549 RepID=A0A4C1WSI3_EUMVA|nr:hypothetical protein EVAR_43363_1 [Eumeta japonica]
MRVLVARSMMTEGEWATRTVGRSCDDITSLHQPFPSPSAHYFFQNIGLGVTSSCLTSVCASSFSREKARHGGSLIIVKNNVQYKKCPDIVSLVNNHTVFRRLKVRAAGHKHHEPPQARARGRGVGDRTALAQVVVARDVHNVNAVAFVGYPRNSVPSPRKHLSRAFRRHRTFFVAEQFMTGDIQNG